MPNPITKLTVNLLLIIGLFYVPFQSLNAQKSEQYFDLSFKPTKNPGRYYVVTEKKGDRWFREAYYLPERGMAMDGWYQDEKCEVPHGEVRWFHENRNLRSITNYSNGKQHGLTLKYHDNGMMSDSANFEMGRRKGICLEWNSEGYLTDSSYFDGAGNGAEVRWYPNGPVSYTGRWTNDTSKVNRWHYYHKNGKLMAIENYVNGKRTECACFDENSIQLDSLVCIEQKEAYFPGKDLGWRKFLERNLNANTPVDNRAPSGSYTVWVQFIVDTDGTVRDIKALSKCGYGMEAEVVRLINKSPAWVPAVQFGQKVKAYRKQPVTFVVTR